MNAKNRSQETERRTIAGLLCIAAVVILVAPPGVALETEICDIEILIDGKPITEYASRGTTYIEALRGREYGVRLSNRTDRRIAVALAVDGLNSIDAKTTDARSASKWVLGPHETTTIEGWQMSAGTARKFFFTTEEHSYGEWLGLTENLGVIEAVVFKEKLPRRTVREWLSGRAAPAPQSAGATRPSTESRSKSAEKSDTDDLAATGIGREIDHRVRRVHLELEHQPATRLRVRYEYRPQLVHLGVLPSPEEVEALDRRERARGFEDFAFAPDPFAGGR
ncbi:MAG: hypothetical protein QNL88_16725 [Acidobacteriota bacterium]|nr:hypothetical protein [Acidobacteriota bacterium]